MDNIITTALYIDAVKDKIIKPRFKISLLRQNESVQEEIIEDIIEDSGALSINYQQGQRRSLNFALNNINGKWNPDPNNNYLWIGSKFKLELGMEINNEFYWWKNGVFVIADPVVVRTGADKQTTLQCYDKFALLDGTLGGNIDGTYVIEVGTNIKQAIKDILMLDNGNGYPIDIMPVLFDSRYKDEVTAYTITKSPNSTLGEMIIELANMIACDVYYNENGNLVFQSGITDISSINKPNLWSFNQNELEYLNSNLTYNFAKVKNRVIVVGGNVNSTEIFSAISENKNAKSPTKIQKVGIKNLYIEDSNIYSNELAQDRADYELNKISIMQLTNAVQSTYMIHLDVNNCIEISDSFLNFKNTKFIIQSLNIPISNNSVIGIQCSNITELPFYPSSS